MDVMLIRLSCDQRSKARSTSFSATETLLERVLVLIPSQRSRMDCSRATNNVPWLTDFFKSAMRSVRSFQLAMSGERTNLSPARMATALMARMARRCCRFLMFISASSLPMKVKRELQGCLAAATDRIDFQAGDFFGRAQLVEHFQKGLVILRNSRTGYRREFANFKCLG